MTSDRDAARANQVLIVEVTGTPAPQGSKSFKGFRSGRAVLVESCAGVPPWRETVVYATKVTMARAGFTTIAGPSAVAIDFYLARPASAPRTRLLPDRRPDLDKLVRAVLDALTTAGAVQDDARVVQIVARKHYALERPPGASISIRPTTVSTG